MTRWSRTLLARQDDAAPDAAASPAARRRWAMLAVVLAGAALVLPTAARPAVAASGKVVPDTAAGIITIYQSPAIHLATGGDTFDGITAGPDGAVWFTNPGNNTIGRIGPIGYVRDYAGAGIANPWEITTGPDGALWFVNFGGPSIGRISDEKPP